jgi:ribosome-associated protein
MLRITDSLWLPEAEVRMSFVRASGPGGQNVNKVSTAVELRFDAARSPSLQPEVRRRLMQLAGLRLTRDGEVVIEAQRHRSQEMNRQEALERLVELLRRAAHRPKPRKKTRPSRAARERRLDVKRRRSRVKTQRRERGEVG